MGMSIGIINTCSDLNLYFQTCETKMLHISPVLSQTMWLLISLKNWFLLHPLTHTLQQLVWTLGCYLLHVYPGLHMAFDTLLRPT